MNYLQRKSHMRRQGKVDSIHRFMGGFDPAPEPEKEDKAEKEAMEDQGLCKAWDQESKQRASVFSILDVDADG